MDWGQEHNLPQNTLPKAGILTIEWESPNQSIKSKGVSVGGKYRG